MTQAAGYALDLYCDAEDPAHRFDEFPHTYTDEHGSTFRRMARSDGWFSESYNIWDEFGPCFLSRFRNTS